VFKKCVGCRGNHTVHGNTSHNVLTEMLLPSMLETGNCVTGWRWRWRGLAYRDLKHELLAIVLGLKGVENGRELLGVELDCIVVNSCQ